MFNFCFAKISKTLMDAKANFFQNISYQYIS